jgi:adenine deaminase
MSHKALYASPAELAARIKAARGQVPADLVIRGAKFLDVFGGGFHDGDVAVAGGVVVGVKDRYDEARELADHAGCYVVPGFIDAHVHIESSLMTPARFQEAVLPCGTTAAIWDPHEIANVKGVAGIQWALEASEGLDLDVFVMVPSCVPSTSPELALETSGAALGPADLLPFRDHPRVLGLAEMMNFPGLLHTDADVMAKLDAFSRLRRDGHCPGLGGKDLNAYGVAGIHSCHESTTLAEAREKMQKGVHVLVREGSCAKDADTLLPLLGAYSSSVLSMCSDDRNPLDIESEGHISCIVDKALRAGHAPDQVFRMASWSPARIYGLEDRGAVAPGYLADLVVVRPKKAGDWTSGVEVVAVYKRGRLVDRRRLAEVAAAGGPGVAAFAGGQNLKLEAARAEHFRVASSGLADGEQSVRVIGVIPHAIVTDSLVERLEVRGGEILADPARDVLKIAVLERHHGSNRRSVGFVRGFGLRSGAIATSINHDSHNVIAVGSSDQAIAAAVSELIRIDGGIVVVTDDGRKAALPLPIGGLMTGASPAEVSVALRALKALAADAGCRLGEPFLQLSFLALPVIPALKITDRGMVDVGKFALVPVGCD